MRHLDDAIRRMSEGPDGYVQLRTMLANAIVAQMLPDGVIKGGSAIKMRLGARRTRYTTDLDTATATDPKLYAERLSASLSRGWEGFTGRVVEREPAHPRDVPDEYVMRPFDVKLAYLGKPWCTVPLEVGFDEIGDVDEVDWAEQGDAAEAFEKLGFPAPGRAPLMTLPYQVAQKLHGLTGPGERARDLVDLQLVMATGSVDLAETHRICVRLFAYRKLQAWPPTVTAREGWEAVYAEQSRGLPVMQNLSEAVTWANSLVSRIEAEGETE
ncbi:MAG: nucleotidyl transferase AbiEii/AbiGii toxin family protein [Atopobiaceae bacterium]